MGSDGSPSAISSSQMMSFLAQTVNAVPDSVTSSMMQTPSNAMGDDAALSAAMSADSSAFAMGRVGGQEMGHGGRARHPPAAPQRNQRRFHRRNNMNRNNYFRSLPASQMSQLSEAADVDADSSIDNLRALQGLQHDMGSDAIESSSSFGMIDASTPTERLHRSHSLSLEVPALQRRRAEPGIGAREDESSTDIDLTANSGRGLGQ